MPYPQSGQHSGRKIGQGMIAAAFVILLFMLSWFFSGALEKRRNPNADAQSRTNSEGALVVSLERNRSGHYLINGSINGIAAEFILDTGATDVVIPAALAEAAGLEQGYANQAMTANGLVTVFNTRIVHLQLSGIELKDVRASINPAMHDNMVLLGMSALRQVEFSQRGDQLTLRYHPD